MGDGTRHGPERRFGERAVRMGENAGQSAHDQSNASSVPWRKRSSVAIGSPSGIRTRPFWQ
jgi:hypothetical protein